MVHHEPSSSRQGIIWIPSICMELAHQSQVLEPSCQCYGSQQAKFMLIKENKWKERGHESEPLTRGPYTSDNPFFPAMPRHGWTQVQNSKKLKGLDASSHLKPKGTTTLFPVSDNQPISLSLTSFNYSRKGDEMEVGNSSSLSNWCLGLNQLV